MKEKTPVALPYQLPELSGQTKSTPCAKNGAWNPFENETLLQTLWFVNYRPPQKEGLIKVY